MSCPHDAGKALRWRTLKNQARVMTNQCLKCGRSLDSVRKATIPTSEWDAIEEWDAILERRYQEAYDRAWRGFNENRQARYEAAVAAERQARRDEYARYLQSPEWKYRRQLRLDADRHQCQARLAGCAGRASQVHHLTYEHVGNEPLFDLVSVCSSCHRQISEREGRLRNDDAA